MSSLLLEKVELGNFTRIYRQFLIGFDKDVVYYSYVWLLLA
ncbi:hypothetical protein MtrunA17_Chr1g0184341 [Medicago truncatula]|uniref:Uncharacterized protein n=1 Tax=Medicago truncatula TaxID=3880 RepID=A0A396JV17_MEDTR|nr:hypothetical protein MtrunA17_Chr1g0184341 [Medicago truncatula]